MAPPPWHTPTAAGHHRGRHPQAHPRRRRPGPAGAPAGHHHGPDELREQLEGLSTTKLVRQAAALDPGTLASPTAAATLAISGLARRYQQLDAEIRLLTSTLDQLTATAAPELRNLLGVGPDSAAALLMTAGDNWQRLHSEAGLMLQVGCQVGESSLLSAAHLTLLQALAPLTPGVRYAEGCFGGHLLREDPVTPSVQFGYGGRPPRRPAGAGLGVQVDRAMLERWAVDQAVVV